MGKKERLEKGLLKLGEVAELSHLSIGTIRHYSNIGLIVHEGRTQGNFRLFKKKETLEHLIFIKRLIGQGMNLEQVQEELKKPLQLKEVLLVDDQKDVCEVIQELLKDVPVNLHIEYDGFGAGRALGEMLPDLVILDINLPGVNGFDICRQIKSTQRFAATKILAITGYDSPENAQKIFACGANAYLAKPFEIPDLMTKISELLHI